MQQQHRCSNIDATRAAERKGGGGGKGGNLPRAPTKGGPDLRDETKFPIVYCDMTSIFCQNLLAFTAIVPVHSLQYIMEAFTVKKTWHGKFSCCNICTFLKLKSLHLNPSIPVLLKFAILCK